MKVIRRKFMKKNIFVLCGGKSVEHDISLKSTKAIMNSINRDKYNVFATYIDENGVWNDLGEILNPIEKPEDLKVKSNLSIPESISIFLDKIKSIENPMVFPALHGRHGEDGTIQGMLEILNLPYVGNGVISSALAMDKAVAKDLFKIHGIAQVKHVNISKYDFNKNPDEVYRLIEEKLKYPLYIKPSNSGSSVGISCVKDKLELKEGIDFAFKFDTKVVVEEEIIAREMQVSVVGNDKPIASVPGEFIMERSFFDYNAKYIDGKLIPVVPANLTAETTSRVRKLAEDAYSVLGCYGLARVDIFVDDKDNLFVNEINTMPGFTEVSMTPVLWKATDNTSYTELVEKLIALGEEKFIEKNSIQNKR